MSSLDETRSVEPQSFFDGQRLFAEDLQRIEAFNREMRWQHNRSLHQPGIGNGFAATGRKGDRTVTVGPGYAIDDEGHEIVLTRERLVPVQPVAGDVNGKPQRFLLTMAYPLEDKELEEMEIREGLCETSGAVRRREEPLFCWVALDPSGPVTHRKEILTGRHLVLAEVSVRDCKLDRDISIVQRRDARPPTQPRLGCGLATPDWEPWTPWPTNAAGDPAVPDNLAAYRVAGGLTAAIDTTSAGFQSVPGYLARLDGDRWVDASNGDEEAQKVLLDGHLTISTQTAKGFTVEVLVLQFLTGDGPLGRFVPQTELLELARRWSVGWMGVEG